jgi:hypothetical protein
MRSKEIQSIQINDHVLSYDFEGHDDSYIEGIVEAIEPFEGCDRYKIRTTRRMINGHSVPDHASYYYPAVNGTPKMLGGVCNSVNKIKCNSVNKIKQDRPLYHALTWRGK